MNFVAQCPRCASQVIIPHAAQEKPKDGSQLQFYCTQCGNVLTILELLAAFVRI